MVYGPRIPMNDQRSQWAEIGLDAFCEQTGQTIEDDGLLEVASDFVANIMHLADRKKIAFAEILRKAEEQYRYETQCVCKKCGKTFDAEADGVQEVDVCRKCEVE